jgi:hypothetical protein
MNFFDRIVWDGARQQVSAMTCEWESAKNTSGGEIHETLRSDLHTLATNVISWAAFGQEMRWVRSKLISEDQLKNRDLPDKSDSRTFKLAVEDTIHLVIQNLLLILVAPVKVLRHFSRRYDEIFTAYTEFPLRIKDTIKERQSKMESKSIGSPGLLLDEMIKASSVIGKQSQRVDGLGINILSEDELTGNVFVCDHSPSFGGSD